MRARHENKMCLSRGIFIMLLLANSALAFNGYHYVGGYQGQPDIQGFARLEILPPFTTCPDGHVFAKLLFREFHTDTWERGDWFFEFGVILDPTRPGGWSQVQLLWSDPTNYQTGGKELRSLPLGSVVWIWAWKVPSETRVEALWIWKTPDGQYGRLTQDFPLPVETVGAWTTSSSTEVLVKNGCYPDIHIRHSAIFPRPTVLSWDSDTYVGRGEPDHFLVTVE